MLLSQPTFTDKPHVSQTDFIPTLALGGWEFGTLSDGCQSDAKIVNVVGEDNLVQGDQRQAGAGEVMGLMTECRVWVEWDASKDKGG